MSIETGRDPGQHPHGEILKLFENREIFPPKPAALAHKIYPKPSGLKWKRPRGQGAGYENEIVNNHVWMDEGGSVWRTKDGRLWRALD